MTAIAIIPARGGSKRIPRKNIIPFMGRPMLAWTVGAALKSGQFDKVLVSTDDQEIAEVARASGADVPFLRNRCADDHSTVSQAVLYALTQAQDHWQQDFDTVCMLMPNCPLRTSRDIQSAFEQFNVSQTSFQISVFRFGWMNPWWAILRDEQGAIRRLFPDAVSQRSQDLPELFCPTGAIWIANSSALKEQATFYGGDYSIFELDWRNAIDIDDPADLTMAEALGAISQKAGK